LHSPQDLTSLFAHDGREELDIFAYPRPALRRWPQTVAELPALQRRLRPVESRLPSNWKRRAAAWKTRQDALMLEVHHGFFLSMGVMDWQRFTFVVESLIDRPEYVHAVLRMEAEMLTELAGKFLDRVSVDAVIFSEPIGGNNGSLISPRMYEQFVLESYRPLLETVRRHGVDVIILRTYANARVLIPSMMKYGINCLWACETNAEAMDYRSIRREFGRELRLIGGIDLDALRDGKDAIRREVEEKVPLLLEQGGYVPLLDGRVRADIPFENYIYYRQLLEDVTRR
jgi:uroporphyrinogen decarboxylase